MKLSFLLIICIFYISIKNVKSYGESDNSGYPNYQEREVHAMMNVVRQVPTKYRDTFMTGNNGYQNLFTTNTFPATTPVYYNQTLGYLARSHSAEMAIKNYFSHSSYDGSSWSTRFSSFVAGCPSAGKSIAENIAAGGSTGIGTNSQLLCDSVGGSCVVDTSEDAGHRVNIMGPYKIVGIGFYYNSSSPYGNYWTEDFDNGICGLPTTPIYSGFHTFFYGANAPNYYLSYYSSTDAATKASFIFENGTSIAMTLFGGTTNSGIYTTATSYQACAKYYFSVTSESGKTYRYPDTGYLQLTKTSACAAWAAGSTGSSGSTGSTASTGSTGSTSSTTQTTGSSTTSTTQTTGSSTTSKTTASSSTTSKTTTSTTSAVSSTSAQSSTSSSSTTQTTGSSTTSKTTASSSTTSKTTTSTTSAASSTSAQSSTTDTQTESLEDGSTPSSSSTAKSTLLIVFISIVLLFVF
ncbi:hypothetical protein ACTFIV_007089 [Dictyostelium citrinum]